MGINDRYFIYHLLHPGRMNFLSGCNFHIIRNLILYHLNVICFVRPFVVAEIIFLQDWFC